jgi:L-threonylcarbamoyladenylate synthase
LDPEAIAKIYAAKGRPARNPLIVHIARMEQLEEIVDFPDSGEKLSTQFWPGPLTLIVKKKPLVPDSVTAGLDTVAVRMPSHPVFQELACRCTFPLAAPSANPFGYVSPTRAEHVQAQMGDAIDWILDGGPCERGIESTILSLASTEDPTLLRHGSISADQIANALGQRIKTPKSPATESEESLISPGLMKRHYCPKTPVQLFEKVSPEGTRRSAILFLSHTSCEKANHFSLSTKGVLDEVAKNLYNMLQQLDQKGFQTLYLELPENSGLGVAIRDRMTRAAAQD